MPHIDVSTYQLVNRDPYRQGEFRRFGIAV
jgi:hypothetical protein